MLLKSWSVIAFEVLVEEVSARQRQSTVICQCMPPEIVLANLFLLRRLLRPIQKGTAQSVREMFKKPVSHIGSSFHRIDFMAGMDAVSPAFRSNSRARYTSLFQIVQIHSRWIAPFTISYQRVTCSPIDWPNAAILLMGVFSTEREISFRLRISSSTVICRFVSVRCCSHSGT